MLADFYISRLYSDMKLTEQKNHLGGQIVYGNRDPSKKTASFSEFRNYYVISKPIKFLTFLQNC